jgi:hypothetical protein
MQLESLLGSLNRDKGSSLYQGVRLRCLLSLLVLFFFACESPSETAYVGECADYPETSFD